MRRFILTLTILSLLVSAAFVGAQEATPEATAETPPAYLGVGYEPADNGVRITAIDPISPAAEGGLAVGDVVTAINGEAITAENVLDVMSAYQPGDGVTLTYIREGEGELEAIVTLRERPSESPRIRVPQMERPYLGVRLEEREGQVVVTDIEPGSPAETAGLQADDIITAIDGEAVRSVNQAVGLIQRHQPEETVTVSIERGGEAQDIEATLDRAPGELGIPGGRFIDPHGDMLPELLPMEERAFLGVQLEEAEEGVAIVEVVAESAAETAGLQAGDVITAVNGEAVTRPQEIQETIASLNPGDTVTVTVTRDGESQEIEATLGANTVIPRGDFGQSFVVPAQPGVFRYLPEENAFEVGELEEGSPYAEAGLQTGDRITAINGEPFEMNERHFEFRGEETATITIQRGDETLELEVPGSIILELMLGRHMGGMRIPNMEDGMMPPSNARLGVIFRMLDEEVAQELDIEQTEGAYIQEVQDDSPASEAGLQEGDIVTAVDGETLTRDLTLRDAIATKNAGDEITLTVLRDGETQEITVTLGEPQQFGGMFHFEIPQMRDIPRTPRV